LKTYFQYLSSLNFPEWYLNQPVAGDGMNRYQVVLVVTVESSFQLAVDQVVALVEHRAETEEAEVVGVVVVLVATELVVPSVASKYPPEHSNRL
jgi:DhnA family fructose-bisphosphate aldolase class Ia